MFNPLQQVLMYSVCLSVVCSRSNSVKYTLIFMQLKYVNDASYHAMFGIAYKEYSINSSFIGILKRFYYIMVYEEKSFIEYFDEIAISNLLMQI